MSKDLDKEELKKAIKELFEKENESIGAKITQQSRKPAQKRDLHDEHIFFVTCPHGTETS